MITNKKINSTLLANEAVVDSNYNESMQISSILCFSATVFTTEVISEIHAMHHIQKPYHSYNYSLHI